MRWVLRNENFPRAVILVTLVIAFGMVTHGVTYSPRGLVNILLQGSIVGIAAIGQTFVMLTGGIDVSLFGVGVLASIVGATMMTGRADLSIVGDNPAPLAVGLAAIIIVGLAMGALNGIMVARLRIPPLIATLGMWQIGKGLALLVGGGYTITELPDSLSVLGRGSIAGLPVPVIETLVLFAVAYFVLNHTSFGRSVYAVGGNRGSAYLSGIRVRRVEFFVYVISGLMVSLAGISIEARLLAVTNQTLSSVPIETIAAVAIGGVSIYGGRGTIVGVLLGSLILAVIDGGLGVFGASLDVQNMVKGGIIILAILIEFFRDRSRLRALPLVAATGSR